MSAKQLNPAYDGMTDQQVKRFKYWEFRTMAMCIFGYALFYFVRKNLSIAMPYLNEEMGISKSDLGLFLTLHGLIYGLSKFFNGIWGDRSNARYFLVTGLVFCGYVVSLNWGAWFDASSILSQHWRWCFLLPATIAILGAAVVWAFVRDTPSSVGLPELKTGKAAPADAKPHTKAEEKAEHKAFLRRKVFLNPTIWIIAVGNFFVYIVRFAVLDWGPTMLKEHLHMDISHAGWTVAAFEIAGIAGMLAAGWATDRFFGGRAPRTCVICMLMTALCLVGLYTLNEHTPLAVAIAILMSAGFFIYGPQALVGIAAANIATKRAAATAGGFCGLFGYGSTIVSGWGMGMLVQYTDWSVALYTLVGMALVGTAVFAAAWKAKPNGYDD